MKEPLISSQRVSPNRGVNTFTFLLFFVTLAFSSIIFYVSAQNYVNSVNDANLLSAQYAKVTQIRANLIIVNATDVNATQTWHRLNLTYAACEALQPLFAYEDAVLYNASVAIAAYDALNASMIAYNTSCTDYVAGLNRTLQQLINATTEPSTLLSSGECSASPTIRVDFTYRQLQLNGVDFSFYLFSTRPGGINVTSSNITLYDCSPSILATSTETYSYPVFENTVVDRVIIQPGNFITLAMNSFPIEGFELDKFQIFTKFL